MGFVYLVGLVIILLVGLLLVVVCVYFVWCLFVVWLVVCVLRVRYYNCGCCLFVCLCVERVGWVVVVGWLGVVVVWWWLYDFYLNSLSITFVGGGLGWFGLVFVIWFGVLGGFVWCDLWFDGLVVWFGLIWGGCF